MAIRLVTDSASDITLAEAKKLGLRLVPLTVSINGDEYADGLELSHRGFFEKLIESDAMPTTSQVSPAAFSEVFAELTANGDELVVITLSSKLSGTYQSACIAAEDFPGRVHVVDSLSATMGERLLVLEGLRLASEGMSAAEMDTIWLGEMSMRVTSSRERISTSPLTRTVTNSSARRPSASMRTLA